MSALFEKHRPAALSEVVGQERAVAVLSRLSAARALAGRAYWLSGPSGTGKTTLARIVAAEVSDPLGIEEVDAGAVTCASLDEWVRRSRSRPLWGRGWCLIINEAHGLRKDVIRRLLVVLEDLPAHVAVIFTTTMEGQASLFEDKIDASPLVSRCLDLPLVKGGEKLALSFACAVRKIAAAEGLDGQPIDKYLDLARRQKFNFRGMLQAVEAGCMLS